MERDERVTFERLKRLRRELVEPTLASHGGRLVGLSGAGKGVVGRVAMGAMIRLSRLAPCEALNPSRISGEVSLTSP
jgi:class 3 adenylate cyclase